MRTVAIIPCAGRSTHWGEYLGVEKQLAPIQHTGETILGRTVNLLKDRGIEEIFIITHKSEFREALSGVTFITPYKRDYLSDTLMASEGVWGESNVVLLGDVFFSRGAMQQIVDYQFPMTFFGHFQKSLPVRSLEYRPELFGFRFNATERDALSRALKQNSILAGIRDSGSDRWFWDPQRFHYIRELESEIANHHASRLEYLKTLYKFIYTPDPPIRLDALGLPRSSMWKILRQIRSNVGGYCGVFGKLWGIFALLSKLDPQHELIYAPTESRRPFWDQITHFAQDCDAPEDYDRLSYILNHVNSEDIN
jgi:hypothetical protein